MKDHKYSNEGHDHRDSTERTASDFSEHTFVTGIYQTLKILNLDRLFTTAVQEDSCIQLEALAD